MWPSKTTDNSLDPPPKLIIYKPHKNTPIRSDPAATTCPGAVNDPAAPIECIGGAVVSEAPVVVGAVVVVPAIAKNKSG